ncbi:MAG: formate dehydrogenase accessory sulfurtransferase FdhD [Eubacteriales bacterium]|nr:formate dehydrogenase accessory sulfurtransferase FdhD [Eubacteriales bacterium]
MMIQNAFPVEPLTREVEHRFIGRDGTGYVQTEQVLREHSVKVLVNGRLEMEFVCLPQFLPELILGHLVTEGYLHRAEDVVSLSISRDSAEVTLKALIGPGPMPDVIPRPWETEWVFSLADRFAQGMPLHELTCATHSCFLARGKELLFQCEDTGRHNAVDKAVGYALMNGIDLSTCLLYSSGRMPADMAAKAIRAGIPLLASKGAPTASAVALARQHRLTLLCAARRDRMKLFSDPLEKETIDSFQPIC